jgi:nucleotide-binding universal stress UspA family protein
MSIKNILLALAPRPNGDPGRDFAIAMAKALKAHVSARVYGLEPNIGVDTFGGVPSELLQAYRADVRKDAQQAIARFEQAAAKAKVEATDQMITAPLAAASSIFARLGRTFDISVLTQSEEGISHMGDIFTEAALFHSGRPVIIVPKKSRAHFATQHVLIAWDGGVNAARAVAAAMPLLARAKKIEILTIGEASKDPEAHVGDLQRNLERHGLHVTRKRRRSDDAAKTILKEAEKTSASLVVMGAYGHSRLLEFVFGGATRFMLAHATMPVLMMH